VKQLTLLRDRIDELRSGLLVIEEWKVAKRRPVVPATSLHLRDLLLVPGCEMAEPSDPALGLGVVSIPSLVQRQDVPEPVKLSVLT
jgi:hypothetical protein